MPTAFLLHLRRNAVAYAALFVALGGTSYAAVKLPANSVGARQLRRGAVTAAKIKPHSLVLKDFRSGQIHDGTQGPAGHDGAQGPKGDAGTPGTPGTPGNTGATGASYWMTHIGGLPGGTGTLYGAVLGESTATVTQNDVKMVSPNVDLTASKLVVRVTTAPGAGQFDEVAINDGLADALFCNVVDTSTTCTDDGPSPIPPGTTLNYLLVQSGGAAATQVTATFQTVPTS
jgi:hypothetical protein